MRFILFAALVSFSATASVAAAEETKLSDWPQFQGPDGNNTTPEKGWSKEWPVDGPPVLWKGNVGKGLASFAVVGNKVFTAGNDNADKDTIVCLNLETGKEIWRHTYACKTATHAMPIVPYGPGSTPTVVDGKVYTLSREGDLLCLDAEKGTLLWQKQLVADFQGKRPVYGYASSVLAKQGNIFLDVGGDTHSNVCLNGKSGELLWGKGKGEAGYATPVYANFAGADALVLFKGEALVVLDALTGKELASHATTTRDFSNCATPFVQGSSIFISHTGAEGSTVLNFAGGKLTPTWTERDLGLLFNSGVPWEEKLIVFNDQKRGAKDLRCVDLATGKPTWICEEIEKGTAILSEGHMIVLTNSGEVVLTKPTAEKLEVISRVQVLAGKGYVLPVLSQGRLLCRNNAGDVVCLDVRGK